MILQELNERFSQELDLSGYQNLEDLLKDLKLIIQGNVVYSTVTQIKTVGQIVIYLIDLLFLNENIENTKYYKSLRRDIDRLCYGQRNNPDQIDEYLIENQKKLKSYRPRFYDYKIFPVFEALILARFQIINSLCSRAMLV